MSKSITLAGIIFAAAAMYSFAAERPIIRNLIAAGTTGTKINISWELPNSPSPEITRLFIYRNTKPIASYFDISDMRPVAELPPKSIAYSDTADNFNDYYYAVVAGTTSGIYDIILPSINSTVSGTHLKLPKKSQEVQTTASAKEKLYPSGGLRETPLPYLDLIESQNKKPLTMSDETYKKVRKLGKSSLVKKRSILEPYIFEEDLISPEGGDDFLLFDVLRTTFIQKKYKESVAELERLIGRNLSKNVTDRATFYLGESYYFSRDYKSATTSFLKVYEVYPAAARRWLDSSLDFYVPPVEQDSSTAF